MELKVSSTTAPFIVFFAFFLFDIEQEKYVDVF
jgi:hypothetical protein